MRIGIISDIHGHLPTLEAVLQDLRPGRRRQSAVLQHHAYPGTQFGACPGWVMAQQ